MAPKSLDPTPVTRRSFLKKTGAVAGSAGLAPVLSAPFVSRAMAQTKTLTIVQWSHFVPEYDKWFDNFAKDWGSKNKINVTVDHIPVANVAARAAAEASAQSGHDLFGWNGSGGAKTVVLGVKVTLSIIFERRP